MYDCSKSRLERSNSCRSNVHQFAFILTRFQSISIRFSPSFSSSSSTSFISLPFLCLSLPHFLRENFQFAKQQKNWNIFSILRRRKKKKTVNNILVWVSQKALLFAKNRIHVVLTQPWTTYGIDCGWFVWARFKIRWRRCRGYCLDCQIWTHLMYVRYAFALRTRGMSFTNNVLRELQCCEWRPYASNELMRPCILDWFQCNANAVTGHTYRM